MWALLLLSLAHAALQSQHSDVNFNMRQRRLPTSRGAVLHVRVDYSPPNAHIWPVQDWNLRVGGAAQPLAASSCLHNTEQGYILLDFLAPPDLQLGPGTTVSFRHSRGALVSLSCDGRNPPFHTRTHVESLLWALPHLDTLGHSVVHSLLSEYALWTMLLTSGGYAEDMKALYYQLDRVKHTQFHGLESSTQVTLAVLWWQLWGLHIPPSNPSETDHCRETFSLLLPPSRDNLLIAEFSAALLDKRAATLLEMCEQRADILPSAVELPQLLQAHTTHALPSPAAVHQVPPPHPTPQAPTIPPRRTQQHPTAISRGANAQWLETVEFSVVQVFLGLDHFPGHTLSNITAFGVSGALDELCTHRKVVRVPEFDVFLLLLAFPPDTAWVSEMSLWAREEEGRDALNFTVAPCVGHFPTFGVVSFAYERLLRQSTDWYWQQLMFEEVLVSVLRDHRPLELVAWRLAVSTPLSNVQPPPRHSDRHSRHLEHVRAFNQWRQMRPDNSSLPVRDAAFRSLAATVACIDLDQEVHSLLPLFARMYTEAMGYLIDDVRRVLQALTAAEATTPTSTLDTASPVPLPTPPMALFCPQSPFHQTAAPSSATGASTTSSWHAGSVPPVTSHE